MERRKDLTRDMLSRQNFLKISGLSTGILALTTFTNIPSIFAKDIYPANKITFIVPYKAGGGYDIYARSVSPHLSKYLKEVAPGAKGGDINDKKRICCCRS